MSVPNWYETALLALAAFRTWKLLAEDTILDGLRRHVTSERASMFIACCWCSGFWVALGWWGAWEIWPHGTTIAAVPLVLSAGVGIIAWFTTE